MVGYMSADISPSDAKRIARVQELEEIIAIERRILDTARTEQKALVIDLVQREKLSQARAAKLAGLTRQTVMGWVNTRPRDI